MSELYLVITDGTTTCTIADGAGGATAYRLKYGGWSPRIAGLRASELGGRGPFEDVTETLILNVHGSSMADAYTKIHALQTLVEQAERFERGEIVSAVVIKYSPPDAAISSAANPLQARVLGGSITLPDNISTAHPQAVIVGVRLQLRRTGQWLHAAVSAASAATNNGEVATISLTACDIVSPSALLIRNIAQKGTANSYSDVVVLQAASAADIQVFPANYLLPATGFSAFYDTTNFPLSDTVLRYTPSSTTEQQSGGWAIGSVGVLAIWLNVRNNSSTTTFKIRAHYTNGRMESYTPHIVIPAASGPRWYFVGLIANTVSNAVIQLACTASAASGTLDIDGVALINTDSVDYGCVVIKQPCGYSGENESIDHRALTAIQPYVGASWMETRSSYQGDAYLTSRAATMYYALLQTGSDGSTIHWRATLGGALIQNTWTLARTTGYLTPR